MRATASPTPPLPTTTIRMTTLSLSFRSAATSPPCLDDLDPDDDDERQDEHERTDHVRLRRDASRRGDVDELRERREAARVEVRDDEVVEAEAERQQRGCRDAGHQQWERDLPEREPWRCVQVRGGLLESRVEARDACLDGHDDEADT